MKIRSQKYSVEAIDKVRPHPANPRRGDLEAIEASIAVNGFYGAVIAQASTGLIVVGNHRYRAAVARGATKIPVIRIVCDDVDAEKMAAADNRTHDLGTGYDPTQLVAQLERIMAGSAGSLDGSGYTAIDFSKLEEEAAAIAESARRGLDGAGAAPPPPLATDDEEDLDDERRWPPLPNTPTTQEGDIWILGEHRIMCGDAFSLANRRELIGREVVSLGLMDPPYAIYGSSSGIGADIADDKMIRPFFDQLGRIIMATVAEFAHVYICCDWRSYPTIAYAMKAADLSPKNLIVWDKAGGLGSMYANCHELISFHAKLPPPTAMRSTTKRGQKQVLASNIVRMNRVPPKDRKHNAAKPVQLFEWLIDNSSEPGDLVVDLFLGSGTAVIAAEKQARRCYGFELAPKYVDLVVSRWEALTGKKGQRIPKADRPPVDLPEGSAKGAEGEERGQGGVDNTPSVA